MTTINTRTRGPQWGLIVLIGLVLAAIGLVALVATDQRTATETDQALESTPAGTATAVPDQATVDLLVPGITPTYIEGLTQANGAAQAAIADRWEAYVEAYENGTISEYYLPAEPNPADRRYIEGQPQAAP